jgi:light-regulated signal transduction histidine kinase (bacteriophytochrome)
MFALFFQRQRNAVKALLTLDDVDLICQLTVQEIQKLTGYDRVMIYRFEPDAHGCIIAEARPESAEPFLGLHHPASDIPRQAGGCKCATGFGSSPTSTMSQC